MNLQLKSDTLLKYLVVIILGLMLSVGVFWSIRRTVWTPADFQILDFLYQQAVKSGYAPKSSPLIVYLTITDDTYSYFGKNILDRVDLAKVNDVLAGLHPEAAAYDIIFARSSNSVSDQVFAESIKRLGCVYLPIVFGVSDQKRAFLWEDGTAYERLRGDYLKQPVEKGNSKPDYATKALPQLDEFSKATYNSGHANASSDPDSVYRHHPMLIKVDTHYIPTLSLAVFLDYVRVSLNEVIVDWGNEIRVPATQESYLDDDVVIPIDDHGRTFIPFAQVWGQDFENMFMQNLLDYAKDINLQGNLTEFFEGKFVFIGDVSQGAADIGQTPLEDRVPLIAIHTALLNGLLTNSFYHKWSFWPVMFVIWGIAIVLAFSSLPKAQWVLYVTGGVIFLGIIGFTWQQFIHFTLFPIVTVGGSFLVIFVGLVIGLEVTIDKQRAFVRNAFAKFVPEKVVKELLDHPEKLKLGGEKREISVLFSDLQGFTTISERLFPEELVQLLNQYFTEMTKIIIAEGGIIDKYQGDAIMAEFGAPLHIDCHADMAVSAALKMQRHLAELRKNWAEQELPEFKCRIGINTGEMVVGNIGSDQVFDYTVIGDEVNLASRLEGANKNYNTLLMISESTYNALTPQRFRTRVLDVIKVKGKSKPVKAYEFYGETSDPIDPQDLEYYQNYQAGFEAYLSRNFPLARKKFTSALQVRSNDPAAKWLISRIDALNPAELPEDWDGSVRLTSK